ncbi:hypothetical protein UA08_08781 [Talaromyces atroroseus]|uniref:TLC domain-containing protein n=1 Tax=Talaromyces atroroseus TaxID=1441469 RepID=A0A225A6Q1_TALAT|nr:hypothetical protein UA08_08781 [Talaromyces atroroseus]OKL56092.1 hypothetical protein UA08_08781 [Talaromyces atroroseus]
MRAIALLMPLLASIQAIVEARPVETKSLAALPPVVTMLQTSMPPELIVRDPASSSSSSSTTSSSDSSSTSTASSSSSTDTCHPTIAPDKNGYVPPTECNAMYDYYPSFSTAVAFTTLFGILLVVHFAEACILKASFVWVLTMAVVWEFTGYLTRTFSTKNQQSSGWATATQLLVLLAPLWVNAFDYMVLARMIWFFVPERCIWIFKPSMLAIIFVCLDIGSFFVQATGGLMATPGASASTIQTGLHIYMGGIGIQQFFIFCFLILAIQFHRQMLQLEKLGALQGEKTRWKWLLYSLYFSLAAITVRIIYRLIEYSSGIGLNNPITTHEWFMYVFDAVPMLFATGVWAVVHPAKVLRGPDAKLPPSGLLRILCCGYCCGGCACCRCGGDRKNKKRAAMEHLSSRPRSEEELRPVSYGSETLLAYYEERSISPLGKANRDIGYEPYRSLAVDLNQMIKMSTSRHPPPGEPSASKENAMLRERLKTDGRTEKNANVTDSSSKHASSRRRQRSSDPNTRSFWRRSSKCAVKRRWSIPLAPLVAFGLLYVVNPTDSNIVCRFLFLSYKNTHSSSTTGAPHYGKGPWDIAFVLFYTLVLSFTREFIMQEALRPLARRCGIVSRAKQLRFMEQMYTVIYFGIMGPAGLYVMKKTPEVWYFNTRGMYESFPHKTHVAAFKFYYLFQAAYWAQQALVMLLGLEKPRKDFKELVMHHIVTLALIGLSYRFHFTYMGIAVYITHDISDFFLAVRLNLPSNRLRTKFSRFTSVSSHQVGKSLQYANSPLASPAFAICVTAWIYLRHYLNLRILYSLLGGEFRTIGPYELDWETEQYKCWISNIITFVLLACLQALNLFWLYCLFRSVYRFAVYRILKDDRSDDEEGVDKAQ